MAETEKRYKIKKIETYVKEKKEYSKEIRKSCGVATISLGVLLLGIKGFLESLNIPSNIDVTYINAIITSICGASFTVELSSIVKIINSLKNKLKLDAKIEEINEELDLLETNSENITRGGR